jgi:transposase
MLNVVWLGDLIKVIWHDGDGACLFTKRLEKGRFIWPSPADGVVAITPAQLGYLLSGIDWRHPRATWRQLRSDEFCGLGSGGRSMVMSWACHPVSPRCLPISPAPMR